MPRSRITIDQLKESMNEIKQTIPVDAKVDDVPDDQKWIIESRFHHVARRWEERVAVTNTQFTATSTTQTLKPSS